MKKKLKLLGLYIIWLGNRLVCYCSLWGAVAEAPLPTGVNLSKNLDVHLPSPRDSLVYLSMQ